MPNQHLKSGFPESWRWIQFSHRVEGWLTNAEADQIFKLAKYHTPNHCPVLVELGSWKGKSSVLFAAGLRGKDSPKLYCIDPFGRDENSEYQEKYYDPLLQGSKRTLEEIFGRNIKRFGADDIVRPLKGYSFEFGATWSEPLDLLFIDASHEYEAVLRDFVIWSPFVKPGGVVAFHDVSPQWPGPSQVVRENIVSPAYSPVYQVDSLAWAIKLRGLSEGQISFLLKR